MADKDTRPVAVPFWALDEAVPAMLGAMELYRQMQVAGIPSALEIDLKRFEDAICTLYAAMEAVAPGASDAGDGDER
jgi:hypothetical protein